MAGENYQMSLMAPNGNAPLQQEASSGNIHANPLNGEDSSPDRIMMYYLNDGVYGSLSCLINDAAHTNIEPYLNRVVESSERRYRSVLWGPTCDSIDKITDSCWIPELNVGDWLLIDNMGAYSISLFTDFNGFERAHIYPVVTTETWHTFNLSDIYNIRQ